MFIGVHATSAQDKYSPIYFPVIASVRFQPVPLSAVRNLEKKYGRNSSEDMVSI